MGWGMFLLGSLSLLTVLINLFQLPILPMLTPWLSGIGALLVLASPFYTNGILRGVAIGAYAAAATPFLWSAMQRVGTVIDCRAHWEPLMAWTNDRAGAATFMKIC